MSFLVFNKKYFCTGWAKEMGNATNRIGNTERTSMYGTEVVIYLSHCYLVSFVL